MRFISRYWKGEYPLSAAFWLVFVLPTVAYSVLEPLVQGPFARWPTIYIGVTIVYLVIFRLIIYPWQVVGLLRAADKHYLTYKRAIVRYSVQAAIVASLALTVAHIISSAQALVIYKEKMDFEATRGEKAYTLKLLDQDRILHLRGPLDFGVVEAVRRHLDEQPGIVGVVLDSEGGQIYEGRGLAILINQRGLDTYTFEGCSSACSTAFIGGHKRYLGTNARLGFHQYRLDSGNIVQFYQFYDLGVEEKKDLDLFREKRLNDDFLRRVFQTPHDDMWYPDTRTLIDANVIHGVLDQQEVIGSSAKQ